MPQVSVVYFLKLRELNYDDVKSSKKFQLLIHDFIICAFRTVHQLYIQLFEAITDGI